MGDAPEGYWDSLFTTEELLEKREVALVLIEVDELRKRLRKLQDPLATSLEQTLKGAIYEYLYSAGCEQSRRHHARIEPRKDENWGL